MLDALRGVGGELEAAGGGVALEERIEAGLVDGHFALVQSLDLVRVDVDTNDMITRLGEAGTRDEAHVAGAENSYAHVDRSFPEK